MLSRRMQALLSQESRRVKPGLGGAREMELNRTKAEGNERLQTVKSPLGLPFFGGGGTAPSLLGTERGGFCEPCDECRSSRDKQSLKGTRFSGLLSGFPSGSRTANASNGKGARHPSFYCRYNERHAITSAFVRSPALARELTSGRLAGWVIGRSEFRP